MRRNHVSLNERSYEYIMAHWANFQNVPMCIQTLSDMRAERIHPTLRTASYAIRAASRNGWPKLAYQIARGFDRRSARRLPGQPWVEILIASADKLWVSLHLLLCAEYS